MNHSQHTHRDDTKASPHETRRATGWWWVAAVALVYLVTENGAHLREFLPYALLLACPLMHVFMHGGHGHAGMHGARSSDREDGE